METPGRADRITYLNTASFTFYLIPFAWKRWKRRHQSTSHAYKPLHEQAPVEDALAAHSPPAPARTILPRRSTSLIRTLSPSPALVLHHPSPSTTSQPLSPLHTTSDLPRRRSSSLSRRRPRTLSLSNSRATPARYNGDGDDHLAPLTTEETAKLAAVFCLAWMAANWSLNASLGLTSVGSSTILAGMSGALGCAGMSENA
jgi:solute carrier family 35 protein F5